MAEHKLHEKIIIVDKNDKELGLMNKDFCHKIQGVLHRAATVLIVNDKNQILITKRSRYKKLWPNFWESSCSTHVHKNENYIESGEKRLIQEIGIKCKLNYLLKFRYKAKYKNIGSESEICALLVGKYRNHVYPNTSEVSSYKWVSVDVLEKEIKANKKKYAPWLIIAFEKFLRSKRSIKAKKLQVCIAVIIEKNNKILVFQEEKDKVYEKSRGLWTIPIGKTKENEELMKSALRETTEETGYAVKLSGLIGVYEFFSSVNNDRVLGFAFEAVLLNRKRQKSFEFKNLSWFEPKELLKNKKFKFRKGVKEIIDDYSNGKILPIKQIKTLLQ